MTGQRSQQRPIWHRPQIHDLILTTRDKHIPIRAKLNGTYTIRMFCQYLQATASLLIPETNDLIIAPADQEFPIRTECHRPDTISMPTQSTQKGLPLEGVKPDFTIARACCQYLPIRTKRHGENIPKGIGKHTLLKIGR